LPPQAFTNRMQTGGRVAMWLHERVWVMRCLSKAPSKQMNVRAWRAARGAAFADVPNHLKRYPHRPSFFVSKIGSLLQTH
jgi:hypothetical protein